MMENISHLQRIEVKLKELENKRKSLEHKTEFRLKTFKEFAAIRNGGVKRIYDAVLKQNELAKIRNIRFMEEVIGNTQILSVSPSNELNIAKQAYKKYQQDHLPEFKRTETSKSEAKIVEIKKEKLNSIMRREKLKRELIREEQVKQELENQRRELMKSIALEQRDIMEAKTNDYIRMMQSKTVDENILQELEDCSENLKAFVCESSNQLPKQLSNNAQQSNEFQNMIRNSRNDLTNNYDTDASDSHSTTIQDRITTLQRTNESLKETNAMDYGDKKMMEKTVFVTSSLSVTTPKSQQNQNQEIETKSLNIPSKSFSVSHESLTIKSIAAEFIIPSNKIIGKSSTDSMKEDYIQNKDDDDDENDEFNYDAHLNTFPIDPIPQKDVHIVNKDFKVMDPVEVLESDNKQSLNIFTDSKTLKSSSLEKSTQLEVFTKKETVSSEVIPMTTTNALESFTQNKPELKSEPSNVLIVSNEAEPEDVSHDHQMISEFIIHFKTLDCLKLIRTLFHSIEYRAQMISIQSIYDFQDPDNNSLITIDMEGLCLLKFIQNQHNPLNPESSELLSITESTELKTNFLSHGFSLSKYQIDRLMGNCVLTLIHYQSELLIPSKTFIGVVTSEKLKKDYKKANIPGLMELFDAMTNHMQALVVQNQSDLDQLASFFTNALTWHIQLDELDRIQRKVSKVLQLAAIPPSPSKNTAKDTKERLVVSQPTPFDDVKPSIEKQPAVQSNAPLLNTTSSIDKLKASDEYQPVQRSSFEFSTDSNDLPPPPSPNDNTSLTKRSGKDWTKYLPSFKKSTSTTQLNEKPLKAGPEPYRQTSSSPLSPIDFTQSMNGSTKGREDTSSPWPLSGQPSRLSTTESLEKKTTMPSPMERTAVLPPKLSYAKMNLMVSKVSELEDDEFADDEQIEAPPPMKALDDGLNQQARDKSIKGEKMMVTTKTISVKRHSNEEPPQNNDDEFDF